MATEKAITFAAVESKRRAFARALKDFRSARGKYHDPAAEMPANRVAGCAMLPHRLAMFDKLAPGAVIGEIGADTGALSGEILQRAAPRLLHMFDADPACLDNPALSGALQDGTINTHFKGGALTLEQVPEGYFDALYVTGDTDYARTTDLLRLAADKVAADGVLMVNNYTVWSAVSMTHCGVARAVNEFCVSQFWKLRYFALQEMAYYDVMLCRLDR